MPSGRPLSRGAFAPGPSQARSSTANSALLAAPSVGTTGKAICSDPDRRALSRHPRRNARSPRDPGRSTPGEHTSSLVHGLERGVFPLAPPRGPRSGAAPAEPPRSPSPPNGRTTASLRPHRSGPREAPPQPRRGFGSATLPRPGARTHGASTSAIPSLKIGEGLGGKTNAPGSNRRGFDLIDPRLSFLDRHPQKM